MVTERDGKLGEAEDELVPEDDRVIGQAFRWSVVAFVVIAGVALVLFIFSRDKPQKAQSIQREVEAPQVLDQSHAQMPVVAFHDISREAGIGFVHVSGARGEKLLPETMGGGAGFLDYDGDGDMDLLFVNSDEWPENRKGKRPTMALYRNDGGSRFSDVTAGSGLDTSFYGQGLAAADYDNDGDVDVFITALGSNHLFRNDGGRFREVTQTARVAGPDNAWSTSAGFFDYDNDGDLDLFVCNYVAWSKEIDLRLNFTLNGVDRAYGPPKEYEGTHSLLYRNDGDGTFTDVSAETGIQVLNPATGRPMGKALAVTFADADADGFLDIFVANDTVQNFVFRNLGNGKFEELGATSGVAYDSMGNATGAMGIDVAAYANDDRLGVGIGNFANETTSFYVQQRNPWQFVDVASAAGIGSPSRLSLSFGLVFVDYDLDGWLDLLQANGHLEEEISELQPSQHYRQPAQLFWNQGAAGSAGFLAVPTETLGDLAKPIVGRGAAFADIDEDGDVDVLLTQTGGAPLLLRNDQALGHHWLRVRALRGDTGVDAIGAQIKLSADGLIQRRCVMPFRSYLSQVEPTVTFGLGAADAVDELSIRWPDGETSTVEVEGVDRTIVLRQQP